MLVHGTMRLVARQGLTLREESDDHALLFDPDTGEARALTPVALFCWQRLDGRHSVAEILTLIQDHFAAVPLEVEQDVHEFLQELLTLELARAT